MPYFVEHKHDTTAYDKHVGDIKNRVPGDIYEVDDVAGEEAVVSP